MVIQLLTQAPPSLQEKTIEQVRNKAHKSLGAGASAHHMGSNMTNPTSSIVLISILPWEMPK